MGLVEAVPGLLRCQGRAERPRWEGSVFNLAPLGSRMVQDLPWPVFYPVPMSELCWDPAETMKPLPLQGSTKNRTLPVCRRMTG